MVRKRTPPLPPEQPNQPQAAAADATNLVVFPFRFSDLPLEILQHIFLYCSEPSSSSSSSIEGANLPTPTPARHHPQTGSPEWLPITQVCRSWRTITHAYPLLWSRITPNLNMSWVGVLQQRSEPLLLDVHLRVGSRRDIDDRQVTMTAHAAVTILKEISHRLRSLRLDGPREHVQSTLSNLHAPSSLQSLSINIPLWDLGTAFIIPETLFSFEAPIRTLSFSADRTLHAPDWLFHGLTSFKTGGNVPLLDLLDALRLMPALKHFTLFRCTAVWDEDDVFPTAPISMNRLEEFVVRTESPRHFVMLARHLAIPDAARKRLAVRSTPTAPPEERAFGSWTTWLEALPSLYAARTRGGLQHVRISGGPTRGRFRAWTNEYYDDTARFCFELDWNWKDGGPLGSAPAQSGGGGGGGGARAIESESPFYHLHTLCDELNAGGVRKVIVDGDPSHVVVAAEGYWHELLSRLPCVEELWLYPGTADVLCSACAPPTAADRILQLLTRVYIVEGRLSASNPNPNPAGLTAATGTGSRSGLSETVSEGDASSSSSSGPQTLSASPPSKSGRGLIVAKTDNLDMTPGLLALLEGGTAAAPRSMEVHLRSCEVEDGSLGRLCALAKVRRDYDWVPG